MYQYLQNANVLIYLMQLKTGGLLTGKPAVKVRFNSSSNLYSSIMYLWVLVVFTA